MTRTVIPGKRSATRDPENHNMLERHSKKHSRNTTLDELLDEGEEKPKRAANENSYGNSRQQQGRGRR